jgi:dTDP-4-dehydrorhamnose 3,5-epimerase
MNQFDKIEVQSLKEINLADGDVLHGLKKTDEGFKGFGEVYFSKIKFNAVKAWKFHNKMTLNLIVPIGSVKFVFFNEYDRNFKEIIIGENNYKRIFVPPKIWFGFMGLNENVNLVMNIADIEHNPNEVRKKDIDNFEYTW